MEGIRLPLVVIGGIYKQPAGGLYVQVVFRVWYHCTCTYIFTFSGKGDMLKQLENSMHDVNDKYILLEETEKNAVRQALIEERGRFCHFISCLKPVAVCG